MPMSIIRGHVLNHGTWSGAPDAAAAQIFELARRGYVTIALYKESSEVRLRRTAQPAKDLSIEELYLLASLFVNGVVVTLSVRQKVAVAQRLMTIARGGLLKDSMIRKLTPQQLKRWIYLAYWTIALIGGLANISFVHDVDSFMVLLVCIIVPWLVVWMITGIFMGWKESLHTAKGKAANRPIASFNIMCRQSACEDVFPPDCLPRELPWNMHYLRSLNSGAYDARPEWWEGTWPATREDIAKMLRQAFDILSSSLGQERAPKKKKGWLTDTELEEKIKSKDAYNFFSSLGDFISAGSSNKRNDGYDGGGAGGNGDGDGGGGDGGDGGGGGD